MHHGPLTLDIAGAADMLKVHPHTVRDLINAGALPAAQVGRAYVILTSDVLAFIEQQVARQTAERLGGIVRRRRRATIGPRAGR